MKSMVKTTVALSSLLLLTGCFDFGWSKKADEKIEVATPAQEENAEAATCSHKNCGHDHSKDGHKKHHDNVKTQGMDDDMEEEDEEDNDDAQVASEEDADEEQN